MDNKDLRELSMDELDGVTGGNDISPEPSASMHGYWFLCPYCQQYVEVNDEIERANHEQLCSLNHQ